MDDPATASAAASVEVKRVANTSEETVPVDATNEQHSVPAAKSGHKTISALAVFALGLNAAAAVYTSSPSDFALPDVSRVAELLPQDFALPDLSRLAELLPHQGTSDPVPDPVVAALKDIRSAQLQQIASLQENGSSLQQNTALLQQDSTTIGSLRRSITDESIDVKKISAQITDEHIDVRKMSAQISTLIAKVDSLQRTMEPAATSSIPKIPARARLAAHRRLARSVKPAGPISLGGAPITTAPASSSQGSPES